MNIFLQADESSVAALHISTVTLGGGKVEIDGLTRPDAGGNACPVYIHAHAGLNCRCLKLCETCKKPQASHEIRYRTT